MLGRNKKKNNMHHRWSETPKGGTAKGPCLSPDPSKCFFHIEGIEVNPNQTKDLATNETRNRLVSELHKRAELKGRAQNHMSRELISLPTDWGCKPHPNGPNSLQEASAYIQSTMIPTLNKVKSTYTIEGTGGFVKWSDIFRGFNNPWCVVRSKSFISVGRRLVATMEKVDDSFGRAKSVPVVRNYVKKAR